MNKKLTRLVWERAKHCCEYCQLPQDASSIPFEIDHIIPKKHRGKTHEDNLALSCFYCNSAKGPNLSGIAPESNSIVPLFHPRKQVWSEHFRWNGPVLVGLTATGQATIEVLSINQPDSVILRELLIVEGRFPKS